MKKWALVLCFMYMAALFGDPLPSWHDGEIKQALLNFVKQVTDPAGKEFVPPENRIAVFDQDGTLWVEHPFYTQLNFAIDRLKQLAADHSEWKTEQPYQSLLEGINLDQFTEADIEKIVGITHSGMSVDAFLGEVKHWLKTAVHPRFKRPFTELVYQPMLEVMELLQKAQFTVYIVSGGGQEFIRAFSDEVYKIPRQHVIGTSAKVSYEYVKGEPALIKLPDILLIDDGAGKPASINLFIGKRPLIAFGNSDGDRQMLEWTGASKGPHLELLVHHDDAVREYAYGPDTKVGTFSDALMKEANEKKWHVISMKNDWKSLFK